MQLTNAVMWLSDVLTPRNSMAQEPRPGVGGGWTLKLCGPILRIRQTPTSDPEAYHLMALLRDFILVRNWIH